MGFITRLFTSGVVQVSWTEYKEANPYEQVALSVIANQVLRYKSKMAGAKIR